MKFVYHHTPLHQKRHRNVGNVYYDPSKNDKKTIGLIAQSKMRQNGFLKAHDGPLGMELCFHTPFPKSYSKRKVNAIIENGWYKSTKPDIDNLEKLYLDALSGISYDDDCQIAQTFVEKKWAYEPRVEILLYPLGGNMITEHALTIKDPISIEDLTYLVKKANRLGRQNRDIIRVYSEEDDEGRHIYFEVEGMKIVD